MNFEFTQEEESFRREVRKFIEKEYSPEWRERARGFMDSYSGTSDKEWEFVRAMAKAYVNEKFRQIVTLAHEIHGAIGFAEDHDLPLYFKRAKAWEASFGDADFHLGKIATKAGI